MPSLYKNAVVHDNQGRTIPVSHVTMPAPQLDQEGLQEARLAELLKAAREEDRRKLDELLLAHKEELNTLMEAERKRVYEVAKRSGYDAGLALAQVEAEQLMAEVRHCYHQLEVDRKVFVESCQQEISALILGVTEHLLRQELTASSAALPGLVASAISELVVRRQVVVFVHPSRVAEVNEVFTQWPLPLDGQALLVRGDPTLDKASFRAEDDLGAVLVDLPVLTAKLKLALT